jgi:hypothetical protein
MDKAALINRIDNNTSELLESVAAFSAQEFNTVPFEDSWTPGQVAEHIFKAEADFDQLFKGSSRPTTERSPDEKVAEIKKIFLDFTTKFKSPEYILPSDDAKDQEQLLAVLAANRTILRNAVPILTLRLLTQHHPSPACLISPVGNGCILHFAIRQGIFIKCVRFMRISMISNFALLQ